MPATAGRVRMPANNRVHSSAALQTHGIWQSAIGYDPYAPNKDEGKNSSQIKSETSDPEANNAYASFQGLLALARITGSNADEARGACKRCGRVGHLSFQCRNFLSIKDDRKERDPEAIEAAAFAEINRIKGSGKKVLGNVEESEEESETTDSEVDSEIERIIAERYGKSKTEKGGRKHKADDESSESESDERGRLRKRSMRRSKKTRNDDGRRKKRKRADSSEDERERRHRRRKEKRKSHKSRHNERERVRKVRSDSSDSDDSRVPRTSKRSIM